jgi:hypothetical protein
VDFDDHRQIERLIYLYPLHLDEGRFDRLGELFALADLYIGDELTVSCDPAAVADLWRRFVRIYPTGNPRTRHIVTNLIIEDDGPGRARAHSYVLVVQHTPAALLAPIIAGDYLDRFATVDGAWRFTERRIGNDLFGDLSQHLLQPMEVASDIRPQRWEDPP